ncbi:MAG TPA: hypothetical protein VLS28_09945 [Candidatus Sulfomarinibacteraceae bacterium]|nr:hypothetical protein [Candidatus Sulfomarinibacteraceae bacterium]
MQVLAPEHPGAGRARTPDIARAFVVGGILVVGASVLTYLLFTTEFLGRFTPSGRASAAQLMAGALAWTFALTAPAGFGLVGLLRVGSAMERVIARRRRQTPVLRVAHAVADDHVVATRVRMPDGARVLPELVIGPFGAAVIEELPPPGAVVSRGPRSWTVRLADGRVHMIDHPLERATRDAERVRAWLAGEDADHVVKVYAAVVGTDPAVVRTPMCAYITADQVGPWLASLPPQRSFDTDRRDRVIRMVRAAL